jgi:hypothetical protein
MTVQEAIDEVQRVGTIQAEKGKLKLRFPEPERVRLGRAIEILRCNRESALRALKTESNPAEVPPAVEWSPSLSALAVEVWQASGDPAAARLLWVDWCEWKAAALNRLFLEQGVTKQPGRITAATVRHGERNGARTTPVTL